MCTAGHRGASCALCAIGSFAVGTAPPAATSKCTTCASTFGAAADAITTAGTGSANASACVCTEGHRGASCALCVIGSFAVGTAPPAATSNCTTCASAFGAAADAMTTAGNGSTNASACVCNPGYGGTNCGRCDVDTYSLGGAPATAQCAPCQPGRTTNKQTGQASCDGYALLALPPGSVDNTQQVASLFTDMAATLPTAKLEAYQASTVNSNAVSLGISTSQQLGLADFIRYTTDKVRAVQNAGITDGVFITSMDVQYFDANGSRVSTTTTIGRRLQLFIIDDLIVVGIVVAVVAIIIAIDVAYLASPAYTCHNGQQGQQETDVDCGGSDCPKCPPGRHCNQASDCSNNYGCANGVCTAPTCYDGQKDGSETDTDCGGPDCGACANNKGCSNNLDCLSRVCSAGICQGAFPYPVYCDLWGNADNWGSWDDGSKRFRHWRISPCGADSNKPDMFRVEADYCCANSDYVCKDTNFHWNCENTKAPNDQQVDLGPHGFSWSTMANKLPAYCTTRSDSPQIAVWEFSCGGCNPPGTSLCVGTGAACNLRQLKAPKCFCQGNAGDLITRVDGPNGHVNCVSLAQLTQAVQQDQTNAFLDDTCLAPALFQRRLLTLSTATACLDAIHRFVNGRSDLQDVLNNCLRGGNVQGIYDFLLLFETDRITVSNVATFLNTANSCGYFDFVDLYPSQSAVGYTGPRGLWGSINRSIFTVVRANNPSEYFSQFAQIYSNYDAIYQPGLLAIDVFAYILRFPGSAGTILRLLHGLVVAREQFLVDNGYMDQGHVNIAFLARVLWLKLSASLGLTYSITDWANKQPPPPGI